MKKKEILVVGGGICGLSLLWYLRKALPEHSIKLLEQSSRVGGVINRVEQKDLIFDQGPKTFRFANGSPILELIEEASLTSELIFSSPKAGARYLYCHKKLYKMPHNPLSLLLSPLTRKAIPSLFKELWIQKGEVQDETIGAFVRRRFGNYVADVFVEPFVSGICGGDMHKLSIRSYFPMLKRWEEEHGSVIKGALKMKSTKKPGSGLFNLRGGFSTLTDKLGSLLQEAIYFHQEAKEIRQIGHQLEIRTTQGKFLADHLFLALPLTQLKQMQLPFDQKQSFFHEVASASLVSVSLAYQEDVLPKKGFGYLVPSKEREKILGVLFDAATFPALDSSSYKTKLTVMMGGMCHPEMIEQTDEFIFKSALDALWTHLGIAQTPQEHIVSRYPETIPQYPLYHKERLEQFQQTIKKECPMITLAGSYLTQATVSGCISQSKILAQEYARC